MRTAVLAAALAVLGSVAANPAAAADVANLRCVQDNVPAAGRVALDQDLQRNLTVPKGTPQTYSDATRSSFRTAALACQAKHGWSEVAANAAVLYAMALLARPTMARGARENGLDFAVLERHINGLTDAERARGATGATLDKVASQATREMAVTGANARVAGAIYGILLLATGNLAKFAAN